MRNPRAARPYAQALMAVAEEAKIIDRVSADLDAIGSMLEVSRELRLLTTSPVIREGKKSAIFHEILEPRVNATTLAFVELLIRKKRAALLPDVIEQFRSLRDELQGVVAIEVRSAVEMTPAQQKDLAARLESRTKKSVRLRTVIDRTIKGGLVVRIGDTVLDGSVSRKLERLHEEFLAGGPGTTSHA